MRNEIASSELRNLDIQIEQLMKCVPLKEAEVKMLCEKVEKIKFSPKKSSRKKVMSFKYLHQ
jgi:hypothetical protein